MPYVLKLKDGRLITPFDVKDVLEAVEEYVGEEARQYIEEYLNDNVQEVADYEEQAADYEKRLEKQGEHQREILCNIKEEVEALNLLLHENRLNRARMQGAVKILYQMVNQEL